MLPVIARHRLHRLLSRGALSQLNARTKFGKSHDIYDPEKISHVFVAKEADKRPVHNEPFVKNLYKGHFDKVRSLCYVVRRWPNGLHTGLRTWRFLVWMPVSLAPTSNLEYVLKNQARQ